MAHDKDIGCDWGEGFMSGTAGKWSSCSRKEFLNHYKRLKSKEKWCLAGT